MAHKTQHKIVGSAIKTISLGELDALMDEMLDAKLAGGGVADAYRTVPWLFRGMELRAQSLSSLPFAVMRGDEVVDSSDDWQNAVGFLPNPKRLLWLIEASLTLTGRGYLFREANRIATKNLKYDSPLTVTPKIDGKAGLVGWTRAVNGGYKDLPADAFVYFWRPDALVEIGPPTTSPAGAALRAANVLGNLDEFIAKFFEHGAIKATLLTVEGSPTQGDKDKLKAWWGRMVMGIRRAWQTEVVSASVKPVIVGEGVSDLENNDLTVSKREDIATALGIPQSLLFSNATNFATAQQDDLHWLTKTVVPESEFIASVLNEQVFGPLGLKWKFKPETLDAFQEDEKERAQSLSSLTSAGLPLGVAMEMLGFELPDGYDYADFNPGGRLYKEPPAANLFGQPAPAQGWAGARDQMPPADVGNDQVAAAKAAERLQYKAFVKRNPKRAFRFEQLDAAEQAELIAEVHQEDWQRVAQKRFEDALKRFDEAMR